jgi:hypothetical protein
MTNIVQSTTYIYINRERERERESRPIKWVWSRLRKKIESRSEVEGPKWVMQEIIENHQKLLLQLVKWERAWVTQHPPVLHPKNPVLRFHGWNETVPHWSVYLVSFFFFSFCSFFFPARFFFPRSVFISGQEFFFITFFLAHPWPQVFFGKLLPTPTTYRPSSYQPPTSPHPAGPLPHSPPFALTSITRASDLERIWVAQSFKSTKYPRA